MRTRNLKMARFATVMLTAGAVILFFIGGAESAERFPPPDFETAYEIPRMTQPYARAQWLEYMDVAALVLALSVGTWLTLKKRSRWGIVLLSVFCLAYFGFYRKGCICPIGAIQNVTLGLFSNSYKVPLTAVLFFSLPLVFALLFGRVFCSGVCPLGAIQDLVHIRSVRVPLWLQESLGVLPFVYLGVAVLFAATNSAFLICRYDPFVGFFRLSGNFTMMMTGGVFLILSTFIGRPYCRFLCPYGAILGVLSKMAWRTVKITPDECVVCGLCEDSCPLGAIRAPTPKGVAES